MGMINHWCWPTSQQLQNVSISSTFDLGVFISNDLSPFFIFEKPYLPIQREKM